MKILGIDSSGLVAGVAVVEDDVLLAEYNVNYKKTHSQTLLPMLNVVREMIELDLNSVDAIAIASGPGSFTGLRIGSATAKGLGFALDKPLVEVPTLEGLAYNLCGTGAWVCPLIDARRNQVYTGIYAFRQKELCVVEPQCAVDISYIIGRLNELGETDPEREVIFLGDGVPVYREQLEQGVKIRHSYAVAANNRQRAASVATLGMAYYVAHQKGEAGQMSGCGKVVSAAEHRPEYLRQSQAERERQEKQGVLLRDMTPADVSALAQMEREIFSMPWSEKSFEELFQYSYKVNLVAEQDGRVVGCICMTLIGEEGEIDKVMVTDAMRGRGVGTALVREALRCGSERGGEVFTLEVRKSNAAAIALYEKTGFSSEGIRPDFYDKPKEDAVIMWNRMSKGV